MIDPELKKDYFLLKNYQDNIFSMRGILLKISMYSLEQIDNDTFPLGKFQGVEKIKIKSILQMEIISKIIMYIEDLVILSESFRIGIPYYKLLDKSNENERDVGKIMKEFFNNVSSFSDEEFFKIMACANPKQLDLQEDEKKVIEKNLQNMVNELKRIFNRLGNFSITNHPVFRRYKHAGCPIVFGAKVNIKGTTDFPNFDSYSMVSTGIDPLENVISIPLSKEVLEGYHIIIHGIQLLLKDILTHHIACIERNLKGLIPVEAYSPKDFPKENKEIYKKIVEDFYEKHPSNIEELKKFDIKIKAKKEDIKWYIDLPEFLEECKKIKEENIDWEKS